MRAEPQAGAQVCPSMAMTKDMLKKPENTGKDVDEFVLQAVKMLREGARRDGDRL